MNASGVIAKIAGTESIAKKVSELDEHQAQKEPGGPEHELPRSGIQELHEETLPVKLRSSPACVA